MTPTGSWPMISPGRTGYSPLRMWMSVPQIVVVVTRTTASPTPARGFGTDPTRMSFGPWNTVARIVSVARLAGRGVSRMRVMAGLLLGRTGRRREELRGPVRRLFNEPTGPVPAHVQQGHRSSGRGSSRPAGQKDVGPQA